MKVLIVEPGKYPREADIEHTLEAEQAVVGGTIEAVYPWRDTAETEVMQFADEILFSADCGLFPK